MKVKVPKEGDPLTDTSRMGVASIEPPPPPSPISFEFVLWREIRWQKIAFRILQVRLKLDFKIVLALEVKVKAVSHARVHTCYCKKDAKKYFLAIFLSRFVNSAWKRKG